MLLQHETRDLHFSSSQHTKHSRVYYISTFSTFIIYRILSNTHILIHFILHPFLMIVSIYLIGQKCASYTSAVKQFYKQND